MKWIAGILLLAGGINIGAWSVWSAAHFPMMGFLTAVSAILIMILSED